MKNLIMEMEEYAKDNNVPIIEKESIAYIMKLIKKQNIKNILEIGSAIGYSSILMASVAPDVHVTTIERDQPRYMECLKNIKKAHFEDKVDVYFQDALDINLVDVSYDLIFIDAAKGQYTNFFEKFKYFLDKGGIIICDNIKFHGYVGSKDNIESKNLRQLVGKLEDFTTFLKDNDEFDTEFVDLGDGLSISVRKNDNV